MTVFILILALIFSCGKLEKKEIVLRNYIIEITSKESMPIAQKIVDNKDYEGVIDSIVSDSMFTYYENQLVAKGEWKKTEEEEFIYNGWIVSYDRRNNIVEHREYTDYDIEDNIYRINQNIVYNGTNKIDTAESFYYKLTPKKDNILLSIKTLYNPGRKRVSYLRKFNKDNLEDSTSVVEGENLISKDFFDGQNRYSIRTYYLKDGKKVNWVDMEITNLKNGI